MESKPYRESPSEKGSSSSAKADLKDAKSQSGMGSAAKKMTRDDEVDDVCAGIAGSSLIGAQSKSATGSWATLNGLQADSGDDHLFLYEYGRAEEKLADIQADLEFESLKTQPQIVKPAVARTLFARSFVRGFRIVSMSMRDADNGRLMWRSADWDVDTMFKQEISEDIPRDILKCRVVSREIVFTSEEEMTDFRLEQRVYFKGTCIEEWFFKFGYVMSGSRNSWQQTIDAAPPSEMLPADVLSGHVVFETSFYDGEEFLCKNSVRIYYV